MLRLLLALGAAVDAMHNGCSASHFACSNNRADCVEALARAGCDVGLKDNAAMTGRQTGREMAEAMGHAAVVARLRVVVVDQLRAARAAVPTPEPEPAAAVGPAGAGALAWQLCEAAEEGDAAAVVRLLAAGVDPNVLVAMKGKVLEEVSVNTSTSHCA